MQVKFLLSGIILGFGVVLSSFLVVGAVSLVDIQFPVAELGNCGSEAECRTYCDKSENLEVCLNFAEKYNLISKEELTMARKFLDMGQKGPGGCASKDSCEGYCDDVSHIDECVAFAEQHGFIPPDELEEAKKVQAALKKGAKLPGNCRSKNDCDVYCENPDRMEECIAFAEMAGFIPPEEVENAKKAMAAMKKGVKPPPCRGARECDDYCAEPSNFEQCITFAEAAGFVSSEEAEMARRTKGKGPGGCRSKESCDAFCQDEANFSVCVDFAVEYGLMSKEEAEIAKKVGGKGPGGCKSKKQCEEFCQDPANQEACFNFAKEHGLIPEEDSRRMEEGKQKIKELFEQAPPELIECLTGRLGAEEIEKMRAGTWSPRDISGDINACIQQFVPPQGPKEGAPSPGMPSEEMLPEERGPSEEMMGPSPEEIEQMKEREMERIMEEMKEREMKRIMEEEIEKMMPPAE